MSKYEGITAIQALALADGDYATPQETLSIIENSIGTTAEQQRLRSAKAVIIMTAHSKSGAEYAVLQLISRGFNVNFSDDGTYYIYDITW